MAIIDTTLQRGNWRNVYLLGTVIVLALGWPTLFFPFGRDQGIHATIAYALSEGLVTYRDVFNIKPPLTTPVHLLSQWLFGHSMLSIRALDLAFAVLTSVGLVAVVRRCGMPPSAGGFAVLGFGLIYYSQSYWENSQTDGWAGFVIVFAVVTMLSGWALPASRARLARMGLAGVLLGIAFSLKYTTGAAGILVFAPLLARNKVRLLFSDVIAVILGGTAVLVIIVMSMAAFGALFPFLEIQSFIRGYVAYGGNGIHLFVPLLTIPQSWPVVFVLGLGAVVWAWHLRHDQTSLFHAIIALWIISAVVSGMVQGKGFQYHYLPLVPPYALLFGLAGAWGLERLHRMSVRRPIFVASIIAATITLPTEAATRTARSLAAMAAPAPVKQMRATIPAMVDFDINATLAFSERLSDLRQPGDRLFVWGYETMLYFLQKEPPRYRYPYAWPFVVNFHDGRYTDNLIALLEAAPPLHIVVQKHDATPWVTGRNQSSEEYLASVPELREFIENRYWLVEEVQRFQLWKAVDHVH